MDACKCTRNSQWKTTQRMSDNDLIGFRFYTPENEARVGVCEISKYFTRKQVR